MDASWDDLKLFLAVAETGSLTQAAHRLKMGQPTVSRRLAQLEEQLGNALCERSSDGIRLTALGEQLVEPIRRMAESASLCTSRVENREQHPEGTVRITAPPGIAHDFLVPFAAELKQKYPRLCLQIFARLQYLDLARREADLAIRMRPTQQKELEILFAIEAPVGAYASAAYAAHLAQGCEMCDIAFIGWAPPFEDLAPNPQLTESIPGFTPAFACDDYLVHCKAAEFGLGVIFLPRVWHRFALDRGLVHVPALDPQSNVTGHVQLLASKSALTLTKVRLVADALVAELQQIRAH